VEAFDSYVEKSAKKTGLLLQQPNTTSVVVKALQHGRSTVFQAGQAGRNHPRDGEKSMKPIRSSCAFGSGISASKWIQSDARFNMHQRRRQLLQQLM
jgi:hypothetical protein